MVGDRVDAILERELVDAELLEIGCEALRFDAIDGDDDAENVGLDFDKVPRRDGCQSRSRAIR